MARFEWQWCACVCVLALTNAARALAAERLPRQVNAGGGILGTLTGVVQQLQGLGFDLPFGDFGASPVPQSTLHYGDSFPAGAGAALELLVQRDVRRCVPRLVCQAAAGALPLDDAYGLDYDHAYLRQQSLDGAHADPLQALLWLAGSRDGPPLAVLGRAALLGAASRARPAACLDAYPSCPRDPQRLLLYLNNHRGGLFRLFAGPPGLYDAHFRAGASTPAAAQATAPASASGPEQNAVERARIRFDDAGGRIVAAPSTAPADEILAEGYDFDSSNFFESPGTGANNAYPEYVITTGGKEYALPPGQTPEQFLAALNGDQRPVNQRPANQRPANQRPANQRPHRFQNEAYQPPFIPNQNDRPGEFNSNRFESQRPPRFFDDTRDQGTNSAPFGSPSRPQTTGQTGDRVRGGRAGLLRFPREGEGTRQGEPQGSGTGDARPLGPTRPLPMVFPDRTGTGELRLDNSDPQLQGPTRKRKSRRFTFPDY